MKKVLLSTSAIAMVGAVATSANAADWEINLGGYMEQHVVFGSYDEPVGTDFTGVDVKSDQEFYFRPSLTLDNGLKISARMDFEGASNGGVDEPRLIISGSFGSVTLGEDDIASYDVSYTAPDVTFYGINSGSSTNAQPGGGIFGTSNASMTRTTLPAVASDPVGIKYFTPRFAGFQIGASYARDANQSNNDAQEDIEAAGVLSNIFGVGANYVNSFGGVDVAVSGGWNTGSRSGGGAGDVDEMSYAMGMNLGFAGVTVGGSWGEGNDIQGGTADGRTYDAGISYETGPWGFSFTYLHAELNANDGTGDDHEIDEFLLGANYKLAKGVRLAAFGLYSTQDATAASGVDDTDGFTLGTGIRVDF